MYPTQRAPFYPLPYPVAYPPEPPATLPPPQEWAPEQPHRYVVCRACNTILLSLQSLPSSIRLIRQFNDAVPLTACQTFRTPDNVRVQHSADLAWIRRAFSGLYSHREDNDNANDARRGQSFIPLACRGCRQVVANALLLLRVAGVAAAPDVPHSCVHLSFRMWAISLSDAYGREITAAAEARGFWNVTPAPYAGRLL